MASISVLLFNFLGIPLWPEKDASADKDLREMEHERGIQDPSTLGHPFQTGPACIFVRDKRFCTNDIVSGADYHGV